jgi:hypothetical protein
MNELVKKPDPTALAAYDGERDPLERYLDVVAPRYLVGDMLKFVEGEWLAGKENTKVGAGATFTACPDGWADGWIRWADGAPAETIMTIPATGGPPPPPREQLGYDDRKAWVADRDPWVRSAYLPLLSSTGELLTYATGSIGGHNAITDLLRAYTRYRRRDSNVYPVVALAGDKYLHKVHRKWTHYPIFRLTGWQAKEIFAQALAAAGLANWLPDSAPEPEPLPPIEDDLSDDIPF